jgi:AcrR family transcriptional regulator
VLAPKGFEDDPAVGACRAAASSPWSPREAEILGVTLELLKREGYGGLTLDAVVATVRASKATVHRRWPTKAELVLAAFIEGTQQRLVALETGSLRDDLLQLGEDIYDHSLEHACTLRAVLAEVSRNPALQEAIQYHFLDARKAVFDRILGRAVRRGKIESEAITEDLWDLMPGYLIFRSIWSIPLPTHRTVTDLVDEIIIPSLTKRHG